MMHIALATYDKVPQLSADDQLLIQPLAERGIHAEPAVWTDAEFDWPSVDAVVIRSCWDYHLQRDRFMGWIASLKRLGVKVLNTPETLIWNSNKTYLRDLQRKGVAIIPTLWPESGFELKDRVGETGWESVVVKPRVSATAYRTCVLSAQNASEGQKLLDELIAGPGAMVQEFIEGIQTKGEWSLIFFTGRFSHAVLKLPKDGDFRVQHDFGGTEQIAGAPQVVLDAASRALAAVEPTPLYARIDGVEKDGEFLLMELELIEPALFLKLDPLAPARFADAIATCVKRPLAASGQAASDWGTDTNPKLP
jgi:glutathione synthase/RimK-type ligase-like ATP-grasp enzyme